MGVDWNRRKVRKMRTKMKMKMMMKTIMTMNDEQRKADRS